MELIFKPISNEKKSTIIPLLSILNKKALLSELEDRVHKMFALEHYECVGAYYNNKLIGICGLWYSVRHYVGESVEPDHVIINPAYRGRNIGKRFFNWIYNYTKSKGCEAIELNTYTGNRKSHKFYYNEGFEIFGFHFVKTYDADNSFLKKDDV